ncbi:MAG: portal protein, partial [Gammaproteobacteria bacterium]|nr:portal protein [Gammaproteobacteria bacterium]
MTNKTKNPNNPQSELFRRLTRLFSGPIVNWRTQMNRKIRRTSLDKYATQFKSASGQQFKKSEYSPFDIMHSKIMAQQNRAERYVDYEQMEYMPEIASALDIYADEMTTHSALTPMLPIQCSNEEIKAILRSLYDNVLNVNHNLFGWCRSMCKYGDVILYMDIDERLGIKSVIPLPLREVERMEGEDPSNPNYIQYQWNSGGMTFENWQVAHFRILGNDKNIPYGTSVLDAGRRIWRQLVLMEDAMMAYRIVRSSERRVFYIDVGNIAPQDVESFIQKTITSMKRNQVVDANTGRVDLRYNPLSVEEDYFIPIRGGESSRIDTLTGGQFTGDIDDVKYLRDKLFSALKIPSSYLSSDSDGAMEDKNTLAQKDVRFARTIQRLQRSAITELEKIGIVHLYTLGFRGDDLVSFRLSLNNPSKIAELQELEHWKTKFDIAGGATENFFSRRWIAQNIFDLSDEEFVRNQREMFHDRRYEAALAAAAEEVAEESAGGASGDLGWEEDFDLGGEVDFNLGGDEDMDAAEETESPLLTGPAKRNVDGQQYSVKSFKQSPRGRKYGKK